MPKMKKGVMQGSAIDTVRDFSTVPLALVSGAMFNEIGAVATLIASPYIASSKEGARFGQYTSLLVLTDVVLDRFLNMEGV